ncbi:MAG: transcription factor IIB [Nitrososphaeraceae archaeon]|nr:transcription factor IIB [Nitrososphaeraceae archaeon]
MSYPNSGRCDNCDCGLIYDYSKGEYICEKCGIVVLDQIYDYGPETHSTDFEEKNRNVRASGSLSHSQHDYGLRTEIGSSTKDFGGKTINSKMINEFNNMKRWHSRLRISSSKERRVSNVLCKINECCSSLLLPKTISETAALIYRNFEKNNDAKGKSVICMASASIYYACKRCSILRSMEEIVTSTDVSSQKQTNIKLAYKYYRSLVMDMNLFETGSADNKKSFTSFSIDKTNNDNENENHQNTLTMMTQEKTISFQSRNHVLLHQKDRLKIDQYISKLANMAKIDTKIERLAIDLAHKINSSLIMDGKSPNGIAAAYIYLSSILLGVDLLQIDISGLAGVTEVTIRNRCKDILLNSKLLVTVKPLIIN